LSKVNAIRKKALEHVRNQDWQSAIKEYKRLADLDQSNPNVFNELGDIYLKTGNKNDAYDAFSRAIDSYTRVSLHNNAVAVCKKVLRLIPTRYDVLTKLGLIRKKQGLTKEAESYYCSYMDKLLLDQKIGPTEVNSSCQAVAAEMGDSALVLARVYDCMVKFDLKEQTSEVLQKLYNAYSDAGDDAGRKETEQRLQELGSQLPEQKAPVAEKEGVVITEENIWSASHTEGERVGGDQAGVSTPGEAAPGSAEGRADSVYEYGDVEMGADAKAQDDPAATSTQTMPEPATDEDAAAPETEENVYETPEEEPAQTPPQTQGDAQESPEAPPSEPSQAPGITSSADNVHVSAIIGDMEASDGGAMTEDDYRSHYDLGMAYLEMDLLAEAVREFQMASKSEAYQARALEMIGQCLAIKQLTRGLQVIGEDDSEALGIKYNLGLAYEMVGDVEQARSAFEDVYVEDVTFRDVAKKIEKYS
jgi:tetratricopeptide (TPR) repeat protein